MNFTIAAFVVMATVAVSFAFATLTREIQFEMQPLTQTGDSSLGRNSINWLASTAFAGALFICFVLA